MYSNEEIVDLIIYHEKLEQINRENYRLFIEYIDLLSNKDEESLIFLLADSFIKRLIFENQFLQFSENDKEELKSIYKKFTGNLKVSKFPGLKQAVLEHSNNIKNFLISTNGKQIFEKYAEDKKEKIICEEYSPELQMRILGIKLEELEGPVLDIGCGFHGKLVAFFSEQGMNAYGFDRHVIKSEVLSQSDWHSFDYSKRKWGTIISHMAFTNHFNHHHLRVDGEPHIYAKTFMRILENLKTGGKFYYAPGMEFFERILTQNKMYTVEPHIIVENEIKYTGTIVTKIAE